MNFQTILYGLAVAHLAKMFIVAAVNEREVM
jgi:hypothetical protein